MLNTPATYMRSNAWNTTIYVGATDNLLRRDAEHRNKINSTCFTAKHNLYKLVWFKLFESDQEALREEQRLKGSSRAKKIKLIEEINPLWDDLWSRLQEQSPFQGIASAMYQQASLQD